MSFIEINKIILSCNDDPMFFEFFPIVATAYKKITNLPVLLAFVTNRNENDELVQEFRKYGEVFLYKPVDGIPTSNQGKMARHYLASKQGEDICYIDDIDLIPLNKEFIAKKVAGRPKWHLLCVGAEFWAYGNNGCFSISQMTSEGLIFKDLFNPHNYDWEGFLRQFVGFAKMHPSREDISNSLPMEEGNGFSDEYLIRALRSINTVKEIHKPRDYNWETQTIDRAFWDRIDLQKLYNHEYIFAHCVRPISDPIHKKRIQVIIDYLNSLT